MGFLRSLNRTFYGIETLTEELPHGCEEVLIVPFMELKLVRLPVISNELDVLIVPFMELKLCLRVAPRL